MNTTNPSTLRGAARIGLAALASTLVAAAAHAQFTLTVLHNNDGESKLIGNDPAGFGGAAFFATVLNNERQAATNAGNAVVTISSGDNFLAGQAFAASVANDVYYDALVIGALNYDAITLGNHDFDFGPDVLAEFIGEVSTGTYISANLDFTAEPALQALVTNGRIAKSVTVTKNGQQVGIIGLTTPTITNISSPRKVGVSDNLVAAVQAEVTALTNAGVKHIILSSHLQGIDTEKALVPLLTGVDVVIAGGGDEILANPNDLLLPNQTPLDTYPIFVNDSTGKGVPIVTTNGEYRFLGRLDVTFDANGNVTAASGRPIRVARNDAANPPADAVAPDPGIVNTVITPVNAFIAGLNANIIAQSQAALDGRRDPIRSVETNLGNLVADAFLSVAQARAASFGVDSPQVAFANGGGIRNNSILPAGPISEGTTFTILPFSNFVAIVPNLPLATFKSLIENAVSQTQRNVNSGNIVPVGSNTGRFLQVAGFRVVYNVDAAGSMLTSNGSVALDGVRVKDIYLDNGTPLFLDGKVAPGAPATIDLATSAFTAGGGDGFPFNGAAFTTLGITDQQALRTYLQTTLGGVIPASVYGGTRGRIAALSLGSSPFLPDQLAAAQQQLAAVNAAKAEVDAALVTANENRAALESQRDALEQSAANLGVQIAELQALVDGLSGTPSLTVDRSLITVGRKARFASIQGGASGNARFVFAGGRLVPLLSARWTTRVALGNKRVTRVRLVAASGTGEFSAPVTVVIRRGR